MGHTSINDTPRQPKTFDEFGIAPFEKGLIEFIENTSTPITIALQGEWGSGKTSLMNTLNDCLCVEKEAYYSVWINTWEYALMQDAQSTLIQIITKLVGATTAIANPGAEKRAALMSKVKNIGKIAAKFALNSVSGGAGDIVDAMSDSDKSTVGDLRDDLQDVINTAIETSNKRGFLFFIDDLDRIDPSVAVELLELLKNIFTLDKCVFVLAIDYDVVIKGLKPKFGELTEKNEREFRSFFDKIIQVPFSMPVSSYRIDNFLKQSLLHIGYLTQMESKNTRLIGNISRAANLTVGTNPRAIKRLLNSLSLIKCINDAKCDKAENADDLRLNGEVDLYVNFALVSIQIAYPKIYNILNLHSGFTKWNDATAIQMNLAEIGEDIKNRLEKLVEFDEEWEQVVYRICETDFYLKQKAIHISELLNCIRLEIENSHKSENASDQHNTTMNAVEDYVLRIIKLSAVTNLEAHDNQEVHYHQSTLLKNVRWALIDSLRQARPDLSQQIRENSARVQVNAPIAITDGFVVNLSSSSHKGQIRLKINRDFYFCRSSHNTISDYLISRGAQDILQEAEQTYHSIVDKYANYEYFSGQKLLSEAYHWQNWIYVSCSFYVSLSTVEEFTQHSYIEVMTEVILAMYDAQLKLLPFREEE